jgi:UDP-GlcNAc:undecaprenyl-phosphate GlcNAc-1-phosphate transferase
VVACGLLDDWKGLSPLPKLVAQVAAGLAAGRFRRSGAHHRLPILDLFLTLFWIVGMTNAFNFVDSMDGLASARGGGSGVFMLVRSTRSSPGWLPSRRPSALWRRRSSTITPPSLFLGDSGSQLLGFLRQPGIATPGTSRPSAGLTWFIPIMVLGVPIFDRRWSWSLARRRQPVYNAGLDHTYHRLVALGLDPVRSVVAMQLAAMLLT